VETAEQSDAIQGKGHILVVDDEAPLTRFYALALRQLGYEVTESNNGSDALTYFRKHIDDIDLVLTDQIMPHLTGIQLCEEIHKVRDEIPVILISGHPQDLSKQQLTESGIVGFIYKPVKIRKLAQEVQKAINLS